jgi:hypothetical protein
MSQVAYGKAGQHQTKETHLNTSKQNKIATATKPSCI